MPARILYAIELKVESDTAVAPDYHINLGQLAILIKIARRCPVLLLWRWTRSCINAYDAEARIY